MNNRDMPASPVIDHNGEPLKVVVIGQDDPENKGFSTTNEMNCIGLTKLEAFAMAAMQGLCAHPNFISNRFDFYDPTTVADISDRACLIAKRTLEELESNG